MMMDQPQYQDVLRQLKIAGLGIAKAYAQRDFREAGRHSDKEMQDQLVLAPWEPGLYSDQATNDDQLGFERWVGTEFTMLLDVRLQTPVSLCIAGPWGCGKSSFMRMIQRRIDDQREKRRESLLSVWIDPARSASRGDVVRSFAESLRQEGLALAQELEEAPERALYGLDSKFVPEHFRKTTESDAAHWREMWDVVHSDDEHWSTDRLLRLIRDTRWALLGRHGLGRLFLLVDDLDRCDPEIVIEVLRVHRALLGEWGIVLVYAMDYDIVAQIVGRKFSQNNVGVTLGPAEVTYFNWIVGQHYLEKFFGRRIRPPQPPTATIRAWLATLLAQTTVSDDLGKAVEIGFQANPRRIKHYVNVCGDLFRGIELASSADEVWKPFMDLPRSEVRGLICKVVALALAWPEVFEVARATEPQAIAYAEQATNTGRPVPCIRRRIFGDLRADDGLISLMRSLPAFSDQSEAILAALVAVCDPFLGSSVLRYELSGDIGSGGLQFTTSEDGGAKAPPVTPEDVSRVNAKLDDWAGALNVPDGVQKVLDQVPAPPPGIELFRAKDFSPSSEDLVRGAYEGILSGNARLGQWLAAAASVAPNTDVGDFTSLNLLLENYRDQQGFLSDLLQLGLLRISDKESSEKLLAYRLRAMQRTRNPEVIVEATNLALEHLGISLDVLRMAQPVLGPHTPAILTLIAADLLAAQQLFDEELRLGRAAIRSGMADAEGDPERLQELSDLCRSLGRAYGNLKDDQKAMRIYGAATVMSGRQEQALVWYLSRLKTYGEHVAAMKCELALVDRDPLDSEFWLDAGIAVNNYGNVKNARPWLERAVELAPDDERCRNALSHNVRLTEGPAKAAAVRNRDYVPRPEIEGCLAEAREQHERLLETFVLDGVVEDDGLVLLDPTNLPEWLCERFPRLCGAVERTFGAEPKFDADAPNKGSD